MKKITGTIALIATFALGTFGGGIYTANTDAQVKYNVYDDSRSAKAALRVEIITPVSETQTMTLNDVTSKISAITGRIQTLQAQRAKLVALKNAIQVELNKLPVR